ncbi:MAG: hypothetical protein OWQ59_06750 [Alicyclobacillaceae bacterium]|jgi:hypothetical protein|nr:hypothetical protein [Alicyclobacillaceae bacterium]MCY0895140.1 hypothetical protein [Alicyclobacillaceae bacterium]
MFKFLLAMLIPLGIFIYTWSFGHWMQKKRQWMGAFSAYALALCSASTTGIIFWRMFV